MFERFSRKSMAATGAALLAALGVSGAAIAQGGSGASASPEKPGVESNAPENSATDKDNVQYTAPGDPDYKGAKTAKATNTASTSGKGKAAKKSSKSKSSAAEAPGTEQSPASEQSGSEQPGNESGSEAPGSETANDDGPGGHADEPGNPNADHQFQGQE